MGGNHCSFTEKTITSIMASQKLGIEMPTSANTMETLSCQRPWWVAETMPSGIAKPTEMTMVITVSIMVRGRYSAMESAIDILVSQDWPKSKRKNVSRRKAPSRTR